MAELAAYGTNPQGSSFLRHSFRFHFQTRFLAHTVGNVGVGGGVKSRIRSGLDD
jgi:hypothetical protein